MKTVNVVAALIINQDKVFATQRGYGEFKDDWEFPGGKIEPGETPEEAIKREIQEELATEILVEQPLTTVEYDYPTFHLSMQCFICKVERGNLTLLEHEAARWLSYDELDDVDWLPADLLVVTAFRKYLVKDRTALVTTLKEFREGITQEGFVAACHNFVEKACGCSVGEANDRSWYDCYEFLQKYLPIDAALDNFTLAFEYMMPDSQKRADVLLLSRYKVIILEFKEKRAILKDDVAQAAGYRQSISHYHYETEKNEMQVEAHLVYTHLDPEGNHHLVDVLHPGNFTSTLQNTLKDQVPMTEQAWYDWIASPFYPLKNIADAILQLFKEGNLPNIKTIREGDIKETLDAINGIIKDPSITKSIIFVSGVPGSGKTLVGLKTVYDHAHDQETLTPIYLSGNDPLVNILQHTLSTNGVDKEGGSYIQSMKDFKYLAHGVTVPLHHIIVFDEAQRAWDTDTKEPGETEATLLLRLGDRIAEKYGKVTILCLIGDGQAIHRHEETGMPLWVNALPNRSDWNSPLFPSLAISISKMENGWWIPWRPIQG